MSIANYIELQAAVADWLNRADLTDRVKDFIRLGESSIRRRQERHTELYSETSGQSLLVTTVPVQLPDYVQRVTAVWGTDSRYKGPIDLLTPTAWRDLVNTNDDAAGIPRVATVIQVGGEAAPNTVPFASGIGVKLMLWPRPDTTFSLDFEFVRELQVLSDVVLTNRLLIDHPDLYLYGALMEAAPYLQHDERIPIWEAKFEKALREVNNLQERKLLGGNPRPIRLPRVF